MIRFLLVIFFLPVTLLAQNWTNESVFDDKEFNFSDEATYEIKIGVNYSDMIVKSSYGENEYKHLILPRLGFGYMQYMNNLIFNPNITINVMGYRFEPLSYIRSTSPDDPFAITQYTSEYTRTSIYVDLDFLFHYQIFNNNSIVAGVFITSPFASKFSRKDKNIDGSIAGEYKGDYILNNPETIFYGLDIAYRINLSNYSASIGFEREIGSLTNNFFYNPLYNIYLSVGYKI